MATIRRTGWIACTDDCCEVIRDTELYPPSTRYFRPMYEVFADDGEYTGFGADAARWPEPTANYSLDGFYRR